MPDQSLIVRVISPQQIFFEGPAASVSSKNMSGNFDILPQHANFLTLIENYPIIIRPVLGKPITFNFPLAIIYTFDDKVNIYTYIQPQLKDTLKQ